MATQNYLVFDFGASNGRAVVARFDGQRFTFKEIHHFENRPVQATGTLYWDALRLFSELKIGIQKSMKAFPQITSLGVDTWGVDFVLLNKQDELLGQPYHYRDVRTQGALTRAFRRVPRAEIFAQTGLQFMELNSLYQLLAWQKQSPAILDAADTLLN